MNKTISAIKRIEERASKLEGVISLAQGIPSFPSHDVIREDVIKAIRLGLVDKYSSIAGLPELRKLISQNLLEKKMIYSWEEEIIVTAGAIEALSSSFMSLLKKEDEIILFTPTYSYYSKIAKSIGVKVIEIILDEKNNWKLPISEFIKSINSKTKAILICNPNNPTGSSFSKNELLLIAKSARKNNSLIILDDVYEDFYYGQESLFNLCTLEEYKDLLIRIVSFSKSFSLSGWRIGFLHAHKNITDKILCSHDNTVNCAPVISQYAAISGMKNRDIIVPEYKNSYFKRKEIMRSYLDNLKNYLNFTIPSGAYYFFPRIKTNLSSEDFCFDLLDKAKVATVPGSDFGSGGEGHIRLCFSRSEEDIHEGMKRISEYLINKKPL